MEHMNTNPSSIQSEDYRETKEKSIQCEGVITSADEEIQLLHDKLYRRTVLLEELRSSYHRDVIMIKDLLFQKENGINKTDNSLENFPMEALPSVDIREILPLFAPTECYLSVKPCQICGGQLELIHNEVRFS